ncbi:MAG TPA: polysaccharide biosynthesis tyrosine autokinase, partial [Chitinophagaceae bacterium]|nr:polysaccharide biosynthesis tyrosine autokinase [Chitinophagaceae bacterium]
VTDNTINFLNDRLVAVGNELRGVEGSVQRFKNKNKLTDLSSDAQQYLAISQQVDAQKAQSQTKLNIINVLEQNLQQNQDNPQLVPSTLGLEEPSLNQLIERHNDLVLQKGRVQQKSGPKNPLLIDLQSQIKEIRAKLLANVINLKQAYMISLNDVSQKDAQLNNLISNVPQLEKNLVQITRNQNVQEQLYAFLLQKSEEAALTRASNIEDSKTILQARSLGIISPKPKLVWLFSILMGFLIPLALISVKEFLNDRVGDITQVKQHTYLPLLGVISHVKKLRTSVVIDSHSRSAVAEQIRNIRTSINYIGNGKDVKTILVTSFQPGDGKSFVSLNLAAGYALLNKKIVMLEFDLRRPHIAKDLGLDTEKGITDVLNGQSSLDDVLVEIEEYGGCLFVMPAGNLTFNPAELISGPAMSDLMKTLQERYDYIILNTPPISVVTDASLLQQYADITLVVLRQGHTSREIYTALKNRTAEHPDDPIYLLLNDVGKNRRYRGGYGYGGYEYGYGYGKKYYQRQK